MSGAVKANLGRPADGSRLAAGGTIAPKRLASVAFSLVVVAILLLAWVRRDDNWISPQTGLGYQLGIVGSVMMLLLLLYPLRKRFASLDWLGQVGELFRLHMVLGIVGPLLVVVHSNFKLGSVNSNVALFSMLMVVGSGIVGRYLYGRIHAGLHGSKSQLAQLLKNANAIGAVVGHDAEDAPLVVAALTNYQAEALKPVRLSNALGHFYATSRARKDLSQAALAAMERQGRANRWPVEAVKARERAVEAHLRDYFSATNKASAFAIYERLFAIWHLLHMPMFFLLILAAIAHVLAVHLY